VRERRREAGLKLRAGARSSDEFKSLQTLALRGLDTFGVFTDMGKKEFAELLVGRTAAERRGLATNLRTLARELEKLAKLVE